MSDRIKASLKGRLLGLTHQDAVYAAKGYQAFSESATSGSTGTALKPYGTAYIETIGDVHQIEAPYEDSRKTLIVTASGSTNAAIQTASGNFRTTGGSTFTHILFTAKGQYAEIQGLSTSIWQVLSNNAHAFSTASST